MAYRIDAGCTACGICYYECPVDCITPDRERYSIDEAACIDCGACAKSCPMRVIVRVTKIDETLRQPASR